MNMEKQPMTNTDIVADFMDFGKQGALNQIFVMTAIDKYANAVVECEKDLPEMMKDSFINHEAWLAIAKEWKTRGGNQ